MSESAAVYGDVAGVAGVVQTKKLTGTTGASEGDLTAIAHGLDSSKIIGCMVLVTADNGNKICAGLTAIVECNFGVFLGSTNVSIKLSPTNSGELLGNLIEVLLFYEA